MRLDKYLSERTSYTRSQAKSLISSGKVCINGLPAKKADADVKDADTVTVSGKELRTAKTLTVYMNKPQGVVSATEDRTEKTVTDILPDEYRGQGLCPVGRLDKDTTGLLLLTNDGELLHNLTSPKKHVPKYYLAGLAEPLTKEAADMIAEGITLCDGTVCRPARTQAADESGKTALICIHEGKYHQVKRMFAAAGNHVESLHRIAVGGFILPENMAPGEVCVLFNNDLCKVLKAEDIFSELITMLGKCSS